jgi:sec-independent protein translocase protein TatC
MPDIRMSFLEHLRELRGRLIRCLVGIGVGSGVGLWFSTQIFHFIMRPVLAALPEGQRKLHPTAIMEKFTVYLKVGLYAGIFLASPVVLWQLWKFISPGLVQREKRYAIPFVLVGTIFFLAGGVFCYLVILPPALSYLVGVGDVDDSTWIEPWLSMNDQLTFVLALELAFGLIFELPLILTLLSMLGLVTGKWLAEKRRYAILINTIAAAVITPTGDPLNMTLMALPMILMYEVGIIGARIFGKKPEPEPAPDAA